MADNNRDRARRDAAGVGPYARDTEQLVSLKNLGGWHVADGEPDIRSWEVRTIGGKELGTVRDLLVDPHAGEVVMLDIAVAGGDTHAHVPIRAVQIDRAARVIHMDSADLEPGDREVPRTVARDVPLPRRADMALDAPESEPRYADTGRVRYPADEVRPADRVDDVAETSNDPADQPFRREERP